MTDPLSRAPAPANWYPDPAIPGLERWWTGSEWSDVTHEAGRDRALSPAVYRRSFWVGLNRLGGRAYRLGRIGMAIAVLGILLAVAIYFVGDPAHSRPWAFAMLGDLVAVAVACVPIGIVTIVWGGIATSRAARLGALGLSVMAIRLGAATAGMGAIVAVVLLLALL